MRFPIQPSAAKAGLCAAQSASTAGSRASLCQMMLPPVTHLWPERLRHLPYPAPPIRNRVPMRRRVSPSMEWHSKLLNPRHLPPRPPYQISLFCQKILRLHLLAIGRPMMSRWNPSQRGRFARAPQIGHSRPGYQVTECPVTQWRMETPLQPRPQAHRMR